MIVSKRWQDRCLWMVCLALCLASAVACSPAPVIPQEKQPPPQRPVEKIAKQSLPDWLITAGGGSHAMAIQHKVDERGNTYLLGHFDGKLRLGRWELMAPQGGGLFITKVDRVGTFVWARSLTHKESGQSSQTTRTLQASALALSADGSIHIALEVSAGKYQFNNQRELSLETGLAFLSLTKQAQFAKIEQLTQKTLGGQMKVSQLWFGKDGARYLAGNSWGIQFAGKSASANGRYRADILCKWDRDGKQEWAIAVNSYGQPQRFVPGADGHVIIQGAFRGMIWIGEHSISNPARRGGSDNLHITRISPQGKHMWSRVVRALTYKGISPLGAFPQADGSIASFAHVSTGYVLDNDQNSGRLNKAIAYFQLNAKGEWLAHKHTPTSLEAAHIMSAAYRPVRGFHLLARIAANQQQQTMRLGDASLPGSNGSIRGILHWNPKNNDSDITQLSMQLSTKSNQGHNNGTTNTYIHNASIRLHQSGNISLFGNFTTPGWFGRVAQAPSGGQDIYLGIIDAERKEAHIAVSQGDAQFLPLDVKILSNGHTIALGSVLGRLSIGDRTVSAYDKSKHIIFRFDRNGRLLSTHETLDKSLFFDKEENLHSLAYGRQYSRVSVHSAVSWRRDGKLLKAKSIDIVGVEIKNHAFDANGNLILQLITKTSNARVGRRSLSLRGITEQMYFVRFDQSGGLQWANWLSEAWSYGNWALQTGYDGHIFIHGYFYGRRGGEPQFGGQSLGQVSGATLLVVSPEGTLRHTTRTEAGCTLQRMHRSPRGEVFAVGSCSQTSRRREPEPPSIFIAKLDRDGENEWKQSQQNDLNSRVATAGISFDGKGNLYLTGTYINTMKWGDATIQSNGGRDAFVAIFDAKGQLRKTTTMGGKGNETIQALSLRDGVMSVIGTSTSHQLTDSVTLPSAGRALLFVMHTKAIKP